MNYKQVAIICATALLVSANLAVIYLIVTYSSSDCDCKSNSTESTVEYIPKRRSLSEHYQYRRTNTKSVSSVSQVQIEKDQALMEYKLALSEEESAKNTNTVLKKELSELVATKNLELEKEKALQKAAVSADLFAITSVTCALESDGHETDDELSAPSNGGKNLHDLYLHKINLHVTCPPADKYVSSTGHIKNELPVRFSHFVKDETLETEISSNEGSTVASDSVTSFYDTFRFVQSCFGRFEYFLYDYDSNEGSGSRDEYFGKYIFNKEEIQKCVETGRSTDVIGVDDNSEDGWVLHSPSKCYISCKSVGKSQEN